MSNTKSQEDIDKWERENFDSIAGLEKDFEKMEITFNMTDKTQITFKIINHEH